MGAITTTDGVQIYFKDWGPRDAQPIVFHHGWPLSSDDSQIVVTVVCHACQIDRPPAFGRHVSATWRSMCTILSLKPAMAKRTTPS
jgi:hypothetical protein